MHIAATSDSQKEHICILLETGFFVLLPPRFPFSGRYEVLYLGEFLLNGRSEEAALVLDPLCFLTM